MEMSRLGLLAGQAGSTGQYARHDRRFDMTEYSKTRSEAIILEQKIKKRGAKRFLATIS